MFIGLLYICTIGSFKISLVSNSQEPTKCVYLANQWCQARPTHGDINSNETFFIHLLTVIISVV